MPKKSTEEKTAKSIRNLLANLNAELDRIHSDTINKGETLETLWQDAHVLDKYLKPLIVAQADDIYDSKYSGASQAALDNLSAWLKKEAPGTLLDEKCRFVAGAAEGSTVQALSDMKDDEPFMRIPRKVMLSVESLKKTKVGMTLWRDQAAVQNPSLCLAAYLALEFRNSASYWRPYLDALPRRRALPVQFPLEDLKHLQTSPVLFDTLKLFRNTIKQYIYVYSLLKRDGHLTPSQPFNYETFTWAVATVMARQNNIPKSETEAVIALVPGWDMLNFRVGKMTSGFDMESDSLEVSTMQEVKKGDTLYMCYGARPNSKLFLFSGFVYPDHPSDSVELVLRAAADSDATDPYIKLRRLLWAKRGHQKDALVTSLPLDPSSPQHNELMLWLSIWVADKDQLGALIKAATVGDVVKYTPGYPHKRASFMALKSEVEATLRRYGTSLAEDEALLQEMEKKKQKSEQGAAGAAAAAGVEESQERQRLCVCMRVNDKRLLARGLVQVTQLLEVLDTLESTRA